MAEMSEWYCPHPDCKDSDRKYSDPPSIYVTCCDQEHEVLLHHDPNRTLIDASLADDNDEMVKCARSHADLRATVEILARAGAFTKVEEQ